jgi:hypothetical protein
MDVQLLCAIGSSRQQLRGVCRAGEKLAGSPDKRSDRSVRAADHNLGHIEEEITHQTRELQRAIAQEAAQKKAAQIPPTCPVCRAWLTRVTHGHERTIQTRFGPITLKRSRGWCPQCKRWFYPTDHVLGIDEGGTASPAVQEMAALLGSKMSIEEATRTDLKALAANSQPWLVIPDHKTLPTPW